MRRVATIGLFLALLHVVACATTQQRSATEDDDSRLVPKYRAVPDASRVSATPARPVAGNALPEVPDEVLSGGCRGGLVRIKVRVGPAGTVLDVTDVPAATAGTDGCHNALVKAVRSTVASWRFVPAYEAPPMGADSYSDTSMISGPANDLSRSPVVGDLEYEFAFWAEGGQGKVRFR